MAAASDVKAGRAFVEILAKDNVQKGLRSAQAKLQAFGAGVAKIGGAMFAGGAAVIAPLLAAVNSFSEAGDKLAKMSDRTGATVEALSELSFAAERSGTSITAVEGAISTLQGTLVEASRGSGAAHLKLAELGQTLRDLKGLSPDKQFERIADRIAAVQDPARRATLAVTAFGGAGRELIPMLSQGSAGIQAMRKSAQELGVVMSGEDARAASAFGDAVGTLKNQLGAVKNLIGAALAPMLTGFAESAATIGASIARWVNRNRELVRTIFRVAVGLTITGTALVTLGAAIVGVGAVLGGLASMLGAASAALAALLSPIGLVSAAVVGLGAYLLQSTSAGGTALKWLGDTFGSLRDTAVEAWGGIADALAAGDIQAAAKILWLALQQEWQKGVNFLQKHWISFKGFFLDVWSQAIAGAAKIFINGWAALQTQWVNLTDFFLGAWNTFTDGLTKGWRTASNFISKGILRLMSFFDSSIDVAAASAELDRDLAGKNSATDRARSEAAQQRDRERQRRLAEIEAGRTGALGEVQSMTDAEQARRQSQFDAELKRSQAALDAAREEFRSARADAAARRPTDGPNAGNLADLMKSLQGGGMATRQASVRGTFSAFAVGGLGGSSAADRTAKATEKTADGVRRLERKLDNTRPKFA